ncbi:MAG: hypothetical protein Q7K43_04355 [Candidatus Woesearchaeota archaeon]|nr:hypothetical protein [Candidatus Woesearchaeota archaeon]
MKNKKQFGLRTLLGGLALLAASHGVYWKSNTVPWCRFEVSDLTGTGYACETVQKNMWGDELTCTLFAYDVITRELKVDEICLQHKSAPFYFWNRGKTTEKHTVEPIYCVLGSGEPCTPQKHKSILHWFERGNRELADYLAKKKY